MVKYIINSKDPFFEDYNNNILLSVNELPEILRIGPGFKIDLDINYPKNLSSNNQQKKIRNLKESSDNNKENDKYTYSIFEETIIKDLANLQKNIIIYYKEYYKKKFNFNNIQNFENELLSNIEDTIKCEFNSRNNQNQKCQLI